MKLPCVVRDRGTQSNFDRLAKAVPGKITRGAVQLSWTSGNAVSNIVTVTHGLGAEPTAVLVTQNGLGGPTISVAQVRVWTATTFDVQATFQSGTAASDLSSFFGWAAFA
jgi:hypothetical protein